MEATQQMSSFLKSPGMGSGARKLRDFFRRASQIPLGAEARAHRLKQAFKSRAWYTDLYTGVIFESLRSRGGEMEPPAVRVGHIAGSKSLSLPGYYRPSTR
jgi:hypothetical protein